MKVHEYQAKEILENYGVAMQPGKVASTVSEAVSAAQEMRPSYGDQFVIKAQIHAGGRGKGGGVKLAHGLEEVKEISQQILGMNLVTHQTGPDGQLVRKILVAPAVNIEKEYYIGVTLDRARSQHVIMASTEGGVEIEKVAADTPEKILKVWVDSAYGLHAFQARELAYGLGFQGKTAHQVTRFILSLFDAYLGADASLAEINPLVLTKEGHVVAIDAKLNLDDNALYRHSDLAALRDLHEEDPLEVEANASNLNYVKLDGNVGCMVNGAGLAMATMDIIKLAGGNPANFLDVGGTASAETVESGFRIILKDPNVKAVLVNIFGGIVRCDRVARGVVDAAQNVKIEVPLIVRLQGTNAEQAQKVLEKSGITLESAVLFEQAAHKVSVALAA
ncbi:MAG: ADP-forming succinate--CoA ligase subunit beta [Bacteroidetes bacterium]|nr:ADP-forming succinate--CoA ligase subunit beta [Bacteroidota bacterium]